MSIKLDPGGYKIVYSINSINKRFIEDILSSTGLKENISEIRTGRGGQLALEKADSKYKNLVIWDVYFDPVDTNPDVNPILNTGWRLSSHIYHIINDNELIKLIPKNTVLYS